MGVSLLNGVSCPTASDCFAEGDSDSDGSGVVVASSDGGVTWTLESAPLNAGDGSVSCVDASDCWAAGSDSMAVTTDGGGVWSGQTLPNGVANLRDVSCATSSACWVIGENTGDQTPVVIATTDGGDTWTPESVPSGVGSLHGLSCPSVSQCWAVGATSTSGVILTFT